MKSFQSVSKKVAVFAVVLMTGSLSAFGQSRVSWSTANDVRQGVRGSIIGSVTAVDSVRSRIEVVADNDRASEVIRVNADPVSSRYIGFGTTSATQNTVYTGANGFTRVRVGDRVDVRGIGATDSMINAEEVVLLGRSLSSGTGTNTSRTSISGTVRQITPSTSRLLLETDNREMLTIFGTSSTPVYFEGTTYKIANIEVGDRVRVEIDSESRDGIRPRSIDVVQSVSDPATGRSNDRTVTSLTGRVTRVDAKTQTIRLDTGRSPEARIDTRAAYDAAGKRFRLTDLQVGDRLTVSGQYDANDLFRADTIRFTSSSPGDVFGDDDRDRDRDRDRDNADDNDGEAFSRVVIYANVNKPLGETGMLSLKDTSNNNREVNVYVDDDFVVRTKAGTYITADQLKANDKIVVKVFRDASGRNFAQTIRMR